MDSEAPVEVRRSAKRRSTVSAYRDGERTVVLIPARMSRAEEHKWVARMLERLATQEVRRRPSDRVLFARAHELSVRFFNGAADPATVRWAGNQRHRWGSCTPSDRSIRLSVRLRGMPAYVIDYVLVHELAHLFVPGHGPQFWQLVSRYPKAERARGYLEGVAAAAGLQLSDEADDIDGAESGELSSGELSLGEPGRGEPSPVRLVGEGAR
ncbi:MAG: SprT-like domain-containing protein [Actinomycetes bacterium]